MSILLLPSKAFFPDLSLARRLTFTCLLVALADVLSCNALQASELKVDLSKRGPALNPGMYGVFFEEISHAGQGGLHADLVRNGDLESATIPAGCKVVNGRVVGWGGWNRELFDSSALPAWSLAKGAGAKAVLALDDKIPLNFASPHCLRMDVESLEPGETAGAENEGYWGMPIHSKNHYELSFFARCKPGFTGPITAALVDAKGEIIANAEISGLEERWKPFKTTLIATGSESKAKLRLSLSAPASVWLDKVSLFPADRLKGTHFKGVRRDLVEMIAALKPGFIRFPGGSFIEGATHETAFRWKRTIGDPALRKGGWSMWGYHVDHGFGYHEMLQFAEDLGCPSLYVAYCGVSCPWSAGGQVQSGPERDLLIQEAVDAVEYARGPETSKFGAMRASNGHPKPFDLRFVQVGNEGSTGEIFNAFQKAIKDRFPEVTVVSSAYAQGLNKARPELVAEHHYPRITGIQPEGFFKMANRFDAVTRDRPPIYVGEYAQRIALAPEVLPPTADRRTIERGFLYAALAEASFMIGMERNGDLVRMASYAPLMAHVNDLDWGPCLLYFDNERVYGQPSYYVQKMFAANRPDFVLQSELQSAPVNNLQVVAGLEEKTGKVILKILNPESGTHRFSVNLVNGAEMNPKAELTLLTSASPLDANSFDEPTKVSPTERIISAGTRFTYDAPAYSLSILRLTPKK